MSRRNSSWVVALAGFVAGLFAVVLMSEGERLAQAQPKAPAIVASPQAPTLTTPVNLGAKPGATTELTLTGTNLTDAIAVVLSCPGKATIPSDNKNGTDAAKLKVKVELAADCPIGMHTIRVITKQGVSNLRPFIVDELPLVAETETNRTKNTPQPVPVPVVVAGRTDTEASDFFQIKVTSGQTLTFEVLARRIGSPLDPIVVLHDAKTKRELIDLYADDTPGLQGDCRLTHTFKDGGEFLVEVRDTTYKGGNDYHYRLRMGGFLGATTAFPLAVQRGQTAAIGFAGPLTADIPAANVKAPTDSGLMAIAAVPRKSGQAGWPVAVRLSDWPESAEKEPNNDAAKANPLPIPGGISGRFEKASDLDHFAIKCKKNVKYAAVAATYELNSPCEVLIRVMDAKGKELARSNPAQATARVEFTAPADGDYVLACEQLNYLSGPNEIYHLSVQPVDADFAIALAFDRYEASAGGGTAVMATVTRLNGYAGPVELSIDSEAGVSGTIVLTAGQPFTFVPLMVKDATKPGGYPFRVRGKAAVNGQDIVRYGTLIDPIKAALGGMSNPPPELFTDCVVAVIEKPAFTLNMTANPTPIEKGKAGKILIETVREKGAEGDIGLVPLLVPQNVTATPPKSLGKGQAKGEIPVNVAAAAATGPTPLVFRATTKVGGKDYAVTPPPVVFEVIGSKKAEPKKVTEKK